MPKVSVSVLRGNAKIKRVKRNEGKYNQIHKDNQRQPTAHLFSYLALF